jgi:hypothetical protein
MVKEVAYDKHCVPYISGNVPRRSADVPSFRSSPTDNEYIDHSGCLLCTDMVSPDASGGVNYAPEDHFLVLNYMIYIATPMV